LRNHFCTGNTTATFYAVNELHVTVNYINNKYCTTLLLWQIYVAGINKMYIGLN